MVRSDRLLAPLVPPLAPWVAPTPTVEYLGGGVPVTILPDKEHSLVWLDVMFGGGDWETKKAGVADAAAEMITRGTELRGAAAIADYIDRYGARLEVHAGGDWVALHLQVLRQHFLPLLALLSEVLSKASFPSASWAVTQKVLQERVRQADAHPATLARRTLQKELFGAGHPYGYMVSVEDVGHITPQMLQEHYYRTRWNDLQVFLTGGFEQAHLEALHDTFSSAPALAPVWEVGGVGEVVGDTTFICRPQSVQTSLAVGQQTITVRHPDYLKLYLTTLFLGGYFGSRLMRTLREEKGYTYGVTARLEPRRRGGAWVVAAEVKKGCEVEAYDMVWAEIERLKTTPAPEEELRRFREYYLGVLLNALDGTFSLSQQLQRVARYGMDLSYYERLQATLLALTPADLQQMAQRYFCRERARCVRVGA